jgi:hypothetical protein
MTAATLQATPHIAMPVPKTISRSSADSEFRTGTKCIMGRSERPATQSSSLSCALDLSKSRAHDAVLDILRAYKLTGNFHVNLEIVLKDIGVFDKVTYQIERNPKLSYSQDCRHVVFKPHENVPNDMFGEIIKSIKARIGFDAPRWVRLFRAFHDKVDPPGVIARLDLATPSLPSPAGGGGASVVTGSPGQAWR